MQELLTKGIGHTKFKKTELGEIPQEWEISILGKVANFENGKAHENSISDDGKYIVVNSKFVSTNGKIKKYSDKNLSPLKVGDIVMVMSDIPDGKALGKCFLVLENDKYTLNQRICLLRPKNGNSKFFYYFLNRNKYFLNFNNGTSQTNLRREEVLNCPFLVPSKHEQEEIAEILSSIDEKISINKKLKEKLTQLKKGLMSDLLSGKIRV
jgi:type I restriction enzyme S subunit